MNHVSMRRAALAVALSLSALVAGSARAQVVSVGPVLASPADAVSFGRALDTDGTRLIIGSFGRAYVYEQSGGAWSEVATLVPFGAGDATGFARSVAILGDYAVVGAQQAEGDQSAIYVFHRTSGTTWVGTQRLTESPRSAAPGAVLGIRLRLEGTTLVASGPWFERFSGTTPMGRVVFWERDASGSYQQVRMLAPLTTAVGEVTYFGFAMDYRAGRLVTSNWRSVQADTWTYAYDAISGVAMLTPVPGATYAFPEHITSLALAGTEVLAGSHDVPGRATFFDRDTGAIAFDPTPVGPRTGTTATADGRWAAVGALPTLGGFVTTFHRDATWIERRTLRGVDPALSFGTAVLVRGASLYVSEPYSDATPAGAGRVHLYTLGCSDDAECGTGGFCVDGVCCNTRCGGACDACVGVLTGQPDGTCAPILGTIDAGPGCFPVDGGVDAGVDADVLDGGAASDAASADAGTSVDAAGSDGGSRADAATTGDASRDDGAVSTIDGGTRPRPALDCTCRASGRGAAGGAPLLGSVALVLAVIGRRRPRAR